MAKLSRAQIEQGLKQIPMETLLFGNVKAAGKLLTPKQKKFAEKITLEGKNKTQAFRETYDTQAAPASQSVMASKIASNHKVQIYMDALDQALVAQKYQTPAHLRALVIHQLTEHALSEAVAPAQRLKALQLLGNITEVAAFTERREVVKVTDANAARDQLMAAIRDAVKGNATDAQVVDADSLLAELTAPPAADVMPADTVPAGHSDDAETVQAQTDDAAAEPPTA